MGDAVVAVHGESTREWLQAADIIVGRHRSRRQARRWIRVVLRDFPGCSAAVALGRDARWYVLGVRGRGDGRW